MAHSDSWSSLLDSQSKHRSSNLLCATKGLNDEYRDTQMLLVVKVDKQDNQPWSSNGMPRDQLWGCGGMVDTPVLNKKNECIPERDAAKAVM